MKNLQHSLDNSSDQLKNITKDQKIFMIDKLYLYNFNKSKICKFKLHSEPLSPFSKAYTGIFFLFYYKL